MLLTKKISVSVTNRNKKYLSSKGYNVNDGNVYIDVNDLPNTSKVKIKVKCVNCDTEKEITYQNYLKQTNNSDYYCGNCKYIKIKKTTKERYGEDSVFKIKEYQNKIDHIMVDKYGTKNALSNEDIKNNMITKLKDKYNVDNVSKINYIKNKKTKTLSNTWVKRVGENIPGIEIIYGEYNTKILKCKCDQGKTHTFDISYDLLYNRKYTKSIFCTICNEINKNISSIEEKFFNFIKDHYTGTIIRNDRTVINPYELDIYLPELNIAFEFNGFRWHSYDKKGKDYHLIKTDMTNKKGIQLIHFYQDDWIYKEEIIKSLILNKIGKTQNKIYARKCIVQEINNIEYRDFCNKNHIQGYAPCKIKYGLFYENKLVSIISLGIRKISGKKIFELIRFVTELNTNVIGGFSKLLKNILYKIEISELITYANKSYSNGELYEKCGFTYICDTKPNYYYIINNKRKHRYMFRKNILVKQGYDKNKTEKQIMSERNILSIYDSGSKKYKMII